jgi:hypothetical protein
MISMVWSYQDGLSFVNQLYQGFLADDIDPGDLMMMSQGNPSEQVENRPKPRPIFRRNKLIRALRPEEIHGRNSFGNIILN